MTNREIAIEKLNGKVWKKGHMDRIYLNYTDLENFWENSELSDGDSDPVLSTNRYERQNGKVWIDENDNIQTKIFDDTFAQEVAAIFESLK